ncbi:MAG: hypothetical protein WD875_12005 [Pirellulales bacterium]
MPRPNPCKPKRRGASDAETTSGAANDDAALAGKACCCCAGPPTISVAPPLVLSRTASGAHLSANVPPCMTLVEMIGAMSVGQTGGVDDDAISGAARMVTYSRTDNAYDAPAGQPEITVYHSLGRRDGGGTPIGPPPLAIGERGWAFFNAQSGRWELVERDRGPWRFELTGTLSPGGSATAELVAWNGSAWATTGDSITVYDSLAMFGGGAGARGLIVWSADSQRWEIIQIDSCECSSAELTCVTVLTDVSMVDLNLIFTRKQLCLPASVTISDLVSLTIEGCCGSGGTPTPP